MELRKSPPKTGVNGSNGKTPNPTLINNNAGLLVDGNRRRFSPRLHKTCPNIGSSKFVTDSQTPISNAVCGLPSFETRLSHRANGGQNQRHGSGSFEAFNVVTQTPNVACGVHGEPNFERKLSPRLNRDQNQRDGSGNFEALDVVTDSGTRIPNVACGVPNFERRLSPRLNGDVASDNQSDACGDHEISSSSVSQIQRRISPRVHQSQQDKSKESTLGRRLSPRLHCHGKNEKGKPLEFSPERRGSPRLGEKGKFVLNGCGSRKRSDFESHTNENLGNVKRNRCEPPEDDDCEGSVKTSDSEGSGEVKMDDKSEGSGEAKMDDKSEGRGEAKMDDSALDAVGRSNHATLKETMKIFNAYYLQFIREEEKRRTQSKQGKVKNSKASKSEEMDAMHISSRPDFKAVYKMKMRKEILYPHQRIGHIPGIEVGYQFFSRAEMIVTGFHSHWLNGVDYIERSTEMEERGHYTFPIAVAIVMSGQDEDDLNNSEDIVSAGQGEHDLVGGKLECAVEVLARGNLAMKNSMDQSIPVRVIRGHGSGGSYSGRVYTYDGLYKVVDTWADKGQRGRFIYKYRLKRTEAEPKLTKNQVLFFRECETKTLLDLPGLVCRDLSNGQEAVCIPVTNLCDDARIDKEFTYIKTLEVAESVNMPPTAAGCDCKGNCTNPKACACAKLNGSDFPYVHCDGRRLFEAKDVVFECGPSCKCGPECLNRTSQRGIKYHLEVYRTHDKGWAVRSWDFIPSGALVCEYIGVVRRSDDVDNISGNDFIFEIDCWHTMNEIEGRERRFRSVPLSATNVTPKIDDKTLDSTPEFCIDAGSRGNVARFINHSCEPNLFVQCILSTHHDLRLARLALFAAEDIPPLQELTYDYGYAVDSVIGPDGKIKVLPCFCGTAECRKRLY